MAPPLHLIYNPEMIFFHPDPRRASSTPIRINLSPPRQDPLLPVALSNNFYAHRIQIFINYYSLRSKSKWILNTKKKKNFTSYLNNWNISSFVMNPSLFKSYTLKQNSIFSRRLPRRYRSRPMIHGSNLIIPSFSRSQQQNMRSTKVSSVITLNVLCNNSRKMVLSIPWQTFISFANSGVENRVSVRLRNISFISSYRNYRLIRKHEENRIGIDNLKEMIDLRRQELIPTILMSLPL